jgi:hypothetical protein
LAEKGQAVGLYQEPIPRAVRQMARRATILSIRRFVPVMRGHLAETSLIAPFRNPSVNSEALTDD